MYELFFPQNWMLEMSHRFLEIQLNIPSSLLHAGWQEICSQSLLDHPHLCPWGLIEKKLIVRAHMAA